MGLFFQTLGLPVLLFSSFPSPAKTSCAQNAPGTTLKVEDGQGARGGCSCRATCGYGAVGSGVHSDMQVSELGSPVGRAVSRCLPSRRLSAAGRQQHSACRVCVCACVSAFACVCVWWGSRVRAACCSPWPSDLIALTLSPVPPCWRLLSPSLVCRGIRAIFV